jgi:hypothetical protein
VEEDLFAAALDFSVYITDVYAPEMPDTCFGLDENNGDLFSENSTPLTNTYYLELDEADGSLLGPLYGGFRVSASDDFASMTSSCIDPFCSYASVSADAINNWSIDEMMLYVDGSLLVSNTIVSESIDNVRLELIGSAPGTWTTIGGQDFYEVAAGDAYFIVAGKGDDEWATLTVSNSTAITATESSGEWTFGSFDIQYVDDSTDTWTMAVGPAVWLED